MKTVSCMATIPIVLQGFLFLYLLTALISKKSKVTVAVSFLLAFSGNQTPSVNLPCSRRS